MGPETLKWTTAAKNLQDALGIVDLTDEPLISNGTEEALERWAGWCSGMTNAIKLDSLLRSNGLRCAFETKKIKTLRLLKWGAE
jgi:hypothetical protein